MKETEQRIAIAEACGNAKRYKRLFDNKVFLMMHEPVLGSHWQRTEEPVTHIDSPVPNYLSDLNAMHEAEKHIPEAKREDYVWNLNLLHPSADIHSSDIRRDIRMEVFELVHATAAHRAEAFLKTLGLWRDEA